MSRGQLLDASALIALSPVTEEAWVRYQVTDAYLASLAASRGAELATLDEALAATLTESVSLIP